MSTTTLQDSPALRIAAAATPSRLAAASKIQPAKMNVTAIPTHAQRRRSRPRWQGSRMDTDTTAKTRADHGHIHHRHRPELVEKIRGAAAGRESAEKQHRGREEIRQGW
jgi:hypothetical protein